MVCRDKPSEPCVWTNSDELWIPGAIRGPLEEKRADARFDCHAVEGRRRPEFGQIIFIAGLSACAYSRTGYMTERDRSGSCRPPPRCEMRNGRTASVSFEFSPGSFVSLLEMLQGWNVDWTSNDRGHGWFLTVGRPRRYSMRSATNVISCRSAGRSFPDSEHV